MPDGEIRVAGVDGAPGGWAIVEASAQLDDVTIEFAETLGDLVERVRGGRLAAAAIDMPIGLLDHHPRLADVLARQRLGPRRSSVFPTPLRTTLAADDYADACERSRARCGKALSKQAYNLIPKIRELDELVTPEDQSAIAEAHPELAFARLNGAPLEHPKATSDGREQRLALLAATFGADLEELMATDRPTRAPITDVIDAMANTTTAARVALGTAESLGDDVDATGKRCAITF